MRRSTLAATILVSALLTAAAQPALASAPTVVTSSFDEATDDFFVDFGVSGRTCAFPVHAAWHVIESDTTFVGDDGNPSRVKIAIDFDGTMSNPESGITIPDGGHFELTLDLDRDGNVTSIATNGVRQNRFLHEAYHELWVPDQSSFANLVRAAGRDELNAKHELQIQPLCDVLAG
jgi:hypothetical protein